MRNLDEFYWILNYVIIFREWTELVKEIRGIVLEQYKGNDICNNITN